MKVLVVTGIWPPDVGGPASHAPEVAGFLHGRGHQVEVVTTAEREPAPEQYPVRWTSRRLPVGVRHVAGARLIRRRAAHADIVYTTGMFGRSAAGATAAQRPFVIKLTADPAFERSRRRGLVAGNVDDFQAGGGGLVPAVLRLARDVELRRAAHVFCPSAYLRELAIGWGVAPERVSVLPNPAPTWTDLPPREELKRQLDVNGGTLAFAGRLTTQKALHLAVEALARTEGVSLLVAGEGPDRPALEQLSAELGVAERVRFLGPRPRHGVLELFRAADASILSSSWENFPHSVVEALSVGTPVLAMKAGGVTEVVRHEENGLLVEPGDAEALGAAIRRFFDDADLRERLRAAAAPSVARFAPERIFGHLEQTLERVARES
jgi:glycosyltransferase involved in cell wall biosynthesis